MSAVPIALEGFEIESFTSLSRRTHDVYAGGADRRDIIHESGDHPPRRGLRS